MPERVSSRHSRRYRLFRFALGLFTLEIGLFLLIFPWREAWSSNYLQGIIPLVGPFWQSAYFRGAVSGLGLANIYLAMLEFARSIR
jgi:hypothetical protein